MIPMNPVPDLPLDILAGPPPGALRRQALQPYAPEVLAFLASLSKALLARPDLRKYPDVATFAYWCRASNLARLARGLDTSHLRMGRGLVLHIAPANVPVNFAFSWAFGLLAGNANVVRIPEARHPQVELICSEVVALFLQTQHQRVASMNCLVRYARSDAITASLSTSANARVLWGGDQTIAHLRALPSPARCVDVAFADRYSFCVLDAGAVLAATEQGLQELAQGFFNDTYLMDQNACSSPHLIVWQGAGEPVERAMQRFWTAMDALLQARYPMQPIHAIDKFMHLCRSALTGPAGGVVTTLGNRAYRVRLDRLEAGIEQHRGQYGYFCEYVTTDLACLKGVVNEKYQTMTCFGLDRTQLARMVVEQEFTGIDRVVPVGQALDIGIIWDGFDLISTLSRIIHAP